VTLRIAFDLDGVLADMESELVRQAEILFGDVMTRRLREGSAEPSPSSNGGEDDAQGAESAASLDGVDRPPQLRSLNLTARQQRKLWHHVEQIEDFWETLDETEPGIVARLGTIAAERCWEIIFLTKRPQSAGATAQVQTQRWLESKGFPRPSVFVVPGSRGRIAAALDLHIVVDDRPENCLDVVVDSTARAILVWRDGDGNLPAASRRLGIGVVNSTAECLDVLTAVETTATDRPTMMNRDRRLLGLKETTGA
jgi:hypothetical protein